MNRFIGRRLLTIAAVAAATVSIGGWAVAQRNETGLQGRSQLQSRGWAGQLDQRLVDQIAVDSLTQASKSQIELANFALAHTQNDNVRKFAQASIDNCNKLNRQLEGFIGEGSRRSVTINEKEDSDSSAQRDRETASQARTANWTTRDFNVIRRDISNQVVANIKRELAQYEGAEFDRAFLGQQLWGHVTFVALAKAGEKQVSSDLRKVIVQAATDTEKQLEDCRKLIRELPSNVARNPETTPQR
jgi:predicted outer membrane protein